MMGQQWPPSMDRMLEHLYASVVDAARFELFALELRTAMNAHIVALQTDDRGHRHHVSKHFTDSPNDVAPPDYANDASRNLFFDRGAHKFQSQGVIDGASFFAEGELQQTAFYMEVLRPMDVEHSMGFCLDAKPNGEITALSVSRDRHRPAFEPETMEFARRLLPHLRNVYQLQQRLQYLESTASVMDRVSYGVWLLGREGEVIRTNLAGQELLTRSQGGLRRRGEALATTWRADETTFQGAIGCGMRRIGGCRADFLLHDALGQAWAACTVHPLHPQAMNGWLPSAQVVSILLVHPLTTSSPAPNQTLRAVFGLTPAEAELADALLQHGSLTGCAKHLGKSHETLRTQLKALFTKTETRRQAELIHRLEAALG